MAEIFLAHVDGDLEPKRNVVIKRLLPHMAGDPQFNAMFLDEAKLSRRLAHSNIAKTYEFGRHKDELFIAMEFVDGLDALAILRECAHRKVRMPTEVAVYIIQQTLVALAYAHNEVDEDGNPLGVVHRDISPSNVLLSRRGEVKLVDFGIARAAQQNHKTRDGTLKGKYGYMSPEQVMDEDLDARSDIFSTGIVLAELLTGRRLFAAPRDLEVLLMVRDAKLDRLDRYGSHIGMDLDRILRKALSKKAEDRFATAAEFGETLSEWMDLRGYQVNSLVIAQIVESLYKDAWRRKRESMKEADDAQVAVAAEVNRTRMVASAPATRLMAGPPTFIEDEYSEPSQIEGIPIGRAEDDETGPVVSIEDADGVVRQEIECVDTNRLPGHDRPVQQITGSTDNMLDAVAESARTSPATTVPEFVPEKSEDRAHTESGVLEAAAPAEPEPLPEPEELVRELDHEIDQLDSPAPAPQSEADSAPIEFAPLPGADEEAVTEDEISAQVAAQSSDQRQFTSIDDAVDALYSSGRDFDGSEVSVRETVKPGDGDWSDQVATTLPPGEPDDTGNFAESAPVAVLYRLAISRATGLLVTSVGGICKHIYFRNGIPEYVSSNVAAELFGEYLVKHGVLLPGELSMALAVMPRYGGKLGDTLVALGLLRPLDVFRHLTRQVRDKLIDVCTWSKGEFQWYGGQEIHSDAFPLDLNTYEVLGAGAMALPDERIEEWGMSVGNLMARMSSKGRTSPERFQLGDIMKQVCASLDGNSTVAELKVGFTGEGGGLRFLRLLYLLVQTDLVTLA